MLFVGLQNWPEQLKLFLVEQSIERVSQSLS